MEIASGWRRQFDAARTPYDARIALGIAVSGSGSFQPLDGDLTAIAGLTGTNTIYYRSAADTWSPVTIGGNMTFSGGVLNSVAGGSGNISNSGTPALDEIAVWTDATHIKGVASATLLAAYAPIASPTFSGDPKAPTPTAGDNDTSIATTAFVTAAIAAAIAGVSGFTTGDAKLTLKTTADTGWIIMNDGTIGSASSGASTRANADCQALFTLIWNNISDSWAPVVGGRGASAAADWSANKKLTLTRQLGRSIVISGTGSGLTNVTLGKFDGEETHTTTAPEMPVHNHSISPAINPVALVDTTNNYRLVAAGGDYAVNQWGGQAPVGNGTYITGVQAGGSLPHNTIDPRAAWNIMLKL